MTPELLDELVVSLMLLAAFLLILSIGCIIADYVFPRIPFIQRWLNSLPDWEEED